MIQTSRQSDLFYCQEHSLYLFQSIETHTPSYWEGKEIELYGPVPEKGTRGYREYFLFIERVAKAVLYQPELSLERRWKFFLGVEAFCHCHHWKDSSLKTLPILYQSTKALDPTKVSRVINLLKYPDSFTIENKTEYEIHQLVVSGIEILCLKDVEIMNRVGLIRGIRTVLEVTRLNWPINLNPFVFLGFGAVKEEEFPGELFQEEGMSDTICFHYVHSYRNLSNPREAYHVYTPISHLDDFFYEIEWVKLAKRVEESSDGQEILRRIEENGKEAWKECKTLSNAAFPAIEPPPSYWGNIFCNFKTEPPYAPSKKSFLKEIGYGFVVDVIKNSSYLSVPNAYVLKSKIEALLQKRGLCFPISILSDIGVLNDKDFVEAYIDHDLILSAGKESLHDHYAHVMSTVQLILKEGMLYLDHRIRVVSLIRARKEKIERDIATYQIPEKDAELLWLGLSSVVDRIWNAKNREQIERVSPEYLITGSWAVFIDRPGDKRYEAYRIKRFPEEFETLHLRYQNIIDRYSLNGYDKKEN